ncbi:MAG: tpiA 1, partial [Frondihabitans sp.]|nr:tpiA 1 [Frondihabitans sp.]
VRLTGPFFEIGPKNFLRRVQLEALVRAAGLAAVDFGVTVVVTVPTALVAPIADLRAGVLVFAQGVAADLPGPSVGVVTVESLVDAGADGVMLNHDSNPLDDETLTRTVARSHGGGLATIVCASSAADSLRFAALGPSAVLFEPPALIGTASDGPRDWIQSANREVRQQYPDVLMMHAGGVGTPAIARSIMAAGADGTGSTSGVLTAPDPRAAARLFIAAARAGWDDHRTDSANSSTNHHQEGEPS